MLQSAPHHLCALLTFRRASQWAVAATFTATASAQPVRSPPASDGCARCEIRLETVAVVGAESDPHLISSSSFAAVDRSGLIYVAEGHSLGVVMIFAPDGKFSRTFGRLGEGPGELGALTSMSLDRGDTLYLFGNRVSLFHRSTGFVRSIQLLPVMPVHSAIPLREGQLLVQGSVRTADLVGKPFHVFDERGRRTHSFGTTGVEPYRHNFFSARRRLAPTTDSSFVEASLTRYELREWSVDGRLLHRWNPPSSWFQPWDPSESPPRDPRIERPRPTVIGVTVDREGLVWVATRVADARWRPRGAAPRAHGHGDAEDEVATADLYDTMLEVFARGDDRPLASLRYPGSLGVFAAPGLATELLEAPSGIVQLKVIRMSLVR